MNDIEKKYKEAQARRLERIRSEPSRYKRFFKWVWYLIAFPFIWIWNNFRDWRTLVIFIIVLIIMSSEIWIPFLAALIVGISSTTGKWLLGIAGTCWSFWLLPGTPFIPICIGITIAIKAIFNKIKSR